MKNNAKCYKHCVTSNGAKKKNISIKSNISTSSILRNLPLLYYVVILFSISPVNCLDTTLCNGGPDLHKSILPRQGNNGFRLKLEGEPTNYEPNRDYTVSLQSTAPVSFRGFVISSKNVDSQPSGEFADLNTFMSRVLPSCPNVVTQANSGKKTRVQLTWTAPSSGSGCVTISASVVQKGTIWFKEGNSLSINLCEQTENSRLKNTQECCSCGNATYKMVFYGKWSPESHPKDYPDFSTHWSNLIGASHSPGYIIWDYGVYASEGVQKVAEWGWPDQLETEIRSQRNHVLSVIKTKAQWPAYEPRNIREPPSSVFTVDNERSLVSILAMLGPSPDWNVGIAKESMCTVECGWVGQKSFDLIPWDAGTDSGVSYMSPNSPTIPHEKIRPLTSSDHVRSPFYDPSGAAISPVATIVVSRLNIEGEQCGSSEHVDAVATETETNSLPQRNGILHSSECMYSDWFPWLKCSVTCGWGLKIRNRMYKGDPTRQSECQETMEKEICKGSDQCINDNTATVCLYSNWTTWSQCSVSCGKGIRHKNRVLQWPSEEENCREPLKEMESCMLQECELADVECMYMPWSMWFPCPVACGMGKTMRKRTIKRKPAHVTSCAGNLIETTTCMTSMTCSQSSENEIADCLYRPWSDWMPCKSKCGIGQTLRKRVLHISISDVPCDEFQMENSKCMTSENCDVESRGCHYGNWSELMPCSVTCGKGETFRKRILDEINSDLECETIHMETTICNNVPCELENSGCIFSSWSGWMPCSVTCGKGITLRKRFLNETASSGECSSFEMEQNRCMVACHVSTSQRINYTTDSPDCSTSEWGSWSSCSITCGRKRGFMTRTRTLIQNSDLACTDTILFQKRKCRVTKCPRDCVLGSWSEWTSCECLKSKSKTMQSRHRKIIKKAKFGGKKCGLRKEKRRCVCDILAL